MSYIDYNEGNHDDEPRVKWRHSDLKSYWRELHAKKFETFGLWGIKETTLLSKLMKEFSSSDLADMMDWWFEHTPHAHSFGAFYNESVLVFNSMKKERDGWSW